MITSTRTVPAFLESFTSSGLTPREVCPFGSLDTLGSDHPLPASSPEVLLHPNSLCCECQCQLEDYNFVHSFTASHRRVSIVAAYDNQGYLAPGGFDLDYQYQVPSPLYSASTVSTSTLVGDQQYSPYNVSDVSPRPSKRQKVVGQNRHTNDNTVVHSMPVNEGESAETAAVAANKPKRVRTGCLTCRERHLKCDEGLPNCQNCRKSSRVCKRGVRLNFIDTTVKSPPIIPPTEDWKGSYSAPNRIAIMLTTSQ